jgi:putative glutamine amidotransferase
MIVLAIVGIAANCASISGTHLSNHVVFDAYVSFVAVHMGCVPLVIPCLGTLPAGSAFSPSAILDVLDGLLLPGSLSNVHPSRYGAGATDGSTDFDEGRDATTFPLIRAAVDRGVPILGICRGAQEINCVFGGSLHQSVHTLPGCLDHRARRDVPQHLKYGPAHSLLLNRGSWLELECSRRNFSVEDFQVNSLHGQSIATLGAGLVADARAPDDVIEAISMPSASGLMIGIQWHPEWHVDKSKINAVILDRFRSAVYRYHSSRRQ